MRCVGGAAARLAHGSWAPPPAMPQNKYIAISSYMQKSNIFFNFGNISCSAWKVSKHPQVENPRYTSTTYTSLGLTASM